MNNEHHNLIKSLKDYYECNKNTLLCFEGKKDNASCVLFQFDGDYGRLFDDMEHFIQLIMKTIADYLPEERKFERMYAIKVRMAQALLSA